MRDLALALAVTLTLIGALFARPALAFEIEEVATFGAGAQVVSVLSTTDAAVFAPVIAGYLETRPDLTVRYTVANSQQVYAAIAGDGAAFDLVISSAMDLQMKLANDGAARAFDGGGVLPDWARWRDRLFAVAQEPVVMIARRADFAGLPLPQSRADLVALLRDNAERFAGRIGTYDPAESGAGYLFATQDARQSDSAWRLSEVAGSLHPQLYTTSAAMIDDVQSGRLALAYNVLGSYAAARPDPGMVVIQPADFTHVLLRTALVPVTSTDPAAGAGFLSFLLSSQGQALLADAGLPPVSDTTITAAPQLRPIRLDPGLLVYVDPMMRQKFLTEWTAAVVQP
ncbi:ABC transporter substrate-binding protein [Loktanella sp. TSTF-M6]|uniref:ABC transporter substrate-binding protein n=1 Tax=Loktanella gaetbuli TaxID=2881335 RepID=A0ABS8BSN8_9RHOB|nr:ABC transporter substrate-binding protein [Loktanella gaetbuli]MCB5198541.1 ABC transporter substrate-binding protein [Loktanella gaetbuli]